jgi:predicted ATPase
LSKKLAAEGGMESALFAGRQSTKKSVRVMLRVQLQDDLADDNEHEYGISIGFVPQKGSRSRRCFHFRAAGEGR